MFDKLHILTRIIEKIKRFPVTFEAMQEWMLYEHIEISDRTLYRYLKEVEELRMNEGRIITINGDSNKKTWKFEYDNSNSEFKEVDITSLILLKGFFPNSFAKFRQDSLAKIEKVVYKTYSRSKFEYHFQSGNNNHICLSTFGEYNYTAQEQEKINRIVWAIIHKRKIELCLLKNETCKTIAGETILPMYIIYHKGATYLMYLLQSNNLLHATDITQLLEFEVLNTMFDRKEYEQIYNTQIRARFGIEANIDKQVYEIVLNFSKEIGNSVCMRSWHQSQTVHQLPDGRWQMKLFCGINNELINWILVWNNHIEIIQPAALLNKISENLYPYLKQNPHFSNS